ncbi:hypothetical protein DRO53_04150 [Candidatus Bathyarchaeota archaeon]|nr:MAG: hypothetical protein DRO53_04150 [Candidatus Bathyarchaeota archaeon]
MGLRLAEASLKAWERSVKHVVSLLSRLLREKGKSLSKATILVMGVSLNTHFKEVSPAIGQLVSRLKARGAKVLVWDPLYSKGELQRLGFQPASPCEDLPKADCLVVAVGHEILGRLKSRILAELSSKSGGVILDCSGENIFTSEDSNDRITVVSLEA